ncbi:hypothetical protein GCM10012275_12130 [Longimycelium tulufanense]|uniref:Uncharacterized protein n=1 Tax=Longimycelium tulufanense TaxID=907463 RepID=A0A8J3FVA8_9PSEU|nr:hypothetical protein GCM10012275_12130 [Longimycelium tulufanense]
MLDAALRKAGAVWVVVDEHPARLVWTVWRAGALWVAVGPDEQEVPGLSDGVRCQVTLRSPTTHSHLLDVPAVAHRVEPDEETMAALAAARLNASPRWAEVYRLDPA